MADDVHRSDQQRKHLQAHYNEQYRDRQYYWDLRSQSRLHMNDVVTIIMDGLDQQKAAFPRDDLLSSKDFANCHRIRLHPIGILCHGYFQAYVYT